jgi:hypothetical protein
MSCTVKETREQRGMGQPSHVITKYGGLTAERAQNGLNGAGDGWRAPVSCLSEGGTVTV